MHFCTHNAIIIGENEKREGATRPDIDIITLVRTYENCFGSLCVSRWSRRWRPVPAINPQVSHM